jgi:NAD(P)-dependent dehydrogenase (short-subunit alcohol dehydrogenase family)
MADWEQRFSLAGRTALVTGASSGIGRAIAEVFADAGADIIGHGRSEERLAGLGRAVEAKGRRFTAITGDLASGDETADVAARALAATDDRIDILVNSAGIAITGPAVDYSVDDWTRTLAVNLTAPFILSKALLPGMMARKMGKIINISSQTGVIALEDHAAYASSKGGLNALTKSLMTEAAPHNVQVNAICPTVVLTEMGKKLWSPPEKRDPFIARTPLGRFGEPVEIADMALYLASPASDLVNGAVMMIEGGYSSI